MIVTLKNIGPIKEASFDLDKDLIVFIGPNNTGKTYAAYCLYGLNKINTSLPNDIVDRIIDDSLINTGKNDLDLSAIFNPDNTKLVLGEYEKKMKNYLPIIFSMNKDFFNESDIRFYFTTDDDLKNYLTSFNFITISIGDKVGFNKTGKILAVDINDKINTDNMADGIFIYDVKNTIIDDTFVQFNRAIDTYFIPAERIGISVFCKDLFSNRFSKTNEILSFQTHFNRRNAENIDRELNVYSLALQNALIDYDKLTRAKRRQTYSIEIESLAQELETKILKGKIFIDKNSNVFYDAGSTSRSLEIQTAGSSIKSLTSLLFYLRYEAIEGQTLIIDEPEINLHPDNQRLVARILAKLSKLGVKVIISTHSDYIIRELNNLIMLNKEHPETQALREKYGYGASEILDHNRVGAYLFKDHQAKPIEVTKAGMEAETIDEEINKLNNTATDIYWTLFED